MFVIITKTSQQANKKQKVIIPDLTPKKAGPRIYMDEERKERQKEYYKKHYHANRAKCDLSTKKSKLCTKGVVKWPGLDLTPRPRGRPRVYTEEEICQHKRDSYKKHYYVTHKEACIERARKLTMHKKLIAQQPQAV